MDKVTLERFEALEVRCTNLEESLRETKEEVAILKEKIPEENHNALTKGNGVSLSISERINKLKLSQSPRMEPIKEDVNANSVLKGTEEAKNEVVDGPSESGVVVQEKSWEVPSKKEEVKDTFRSGIDPKTKIKTIKGEITFNDNDLKPFKCGICSNGFRSLSELRTHKKDEH